MGRSGIHEPIPSPDQPPDQPDVAIGPLIRTKLAPPRTESAPVERQLLLERLDRRRECRLTLALGPAGSGKTMLLAQWRKHLLLRGRVVAWYNVGADDDDGAFASYLVEALRGAGLAVGMQALVAFLRTGADAFDILLGALIDALDDAGHDVHLVLDDFHLACGSLSQRLVDRLIEHAPASFHLTLGSRAHPALSLARLRAQDQVNELGYEDLRFDIGEVGRFAAAQGLHGLTDDQLAALHRDTDGWAVGLQLAAFSMRHARNGGPAVRRIRGVPGQSMAALLEYIDETTACHLSEQELRFLTVVSLCRRFNRTLCELLTGDPRAGEHLERFRRENLFLLPIDTPDIEPWFRFHRLFASFLNSRLARFDAAELRKLHQLASHWFAAQGLFTEAIRHARLAQDDDLAVDLIDRSLDRVSRGAHVAEFLDWCDALPREKLRSRPHAYALRAMAELSFRRFDRFAESVRDLDLMQQTHPELRGMARAIRVFGALARDRTDEAIELGEPQIASIPSGQPLSDLMLISFVGFALAQVGRGQQAREVARLRFAQQCAAPEARGLMPYVRPIEGLASLMDGDIRDAERVLSAQLESLVGDEAFSFESAGITTGLLVEASYQADHLDVARGLLERYFDVITAAGLPDNAIFAFRVRARLQAIDHHHAAAAQTLARMEEMGLRLGLDRLVAWSLYDQLALPDRSPRYAELLSRLECLALKHAPGDLPRATDEIVLCAQMALAEQSLQTDQHARSLELLDRAGRTAGRLGRRLHETRIGLLRAMLYVRAGERERAAALARELLAVAQALGMVRMVKDLGSGALPLLSLLRDTVREPPLLAFVEEAMQTGADAPVAADHGAPVADGMPREILSARELEALQLLAQALSVKSIARAMVLSPETVKWHLKNVYGKLGARSREEALALARAQGIVP
ncbi:helix-turn-helix transcriptional regulator [Sinimarinibacterium flocculans]|uniref:helix-turn-helix transcriptional regulator n=1 Tax=Sinimarinibacterium flocculans TaxID=985250 RepID=UPI0035148187